MLDLKKDRSKLWAYHTCEIDNLIINAFHLDQIMYRNAFCLRPNVAQ